MAKLLSVKQTIANYQISRTKLYALIGSGEIAARKLGRRTVIAETEMERYAASLPAYRPRAENRAA